MTDDQLIELRWVLTANCWDRHGGAYPTCDECRRNFPLLMELANG